MLVRRSLSLAAALLAAFHAWLFLNQAWAGELVDVALVSRWLIAAGLIAALVHLRRRGLSTVRGRHAVAVWLLAALLHGPAAARNIDGLEPSMPEVVSTLAQIVANIATVASFLVVLFGLRAGRAAVTFGPSALNAPAFIGALPPRAFLTFAPRPPPA